MRILIDGHEALNRRKTGIGSYALMLADAARELGHAVSWLTSAPVSLAPAQNATGKLADEIALFEEPESPRGLREKAATLRRMAYGLAHAHAIAHEVTLSGKVADDIGVYSGDRVFAAGNAIWHAHYRHMLMRDFTTLRTDEPFDVFHLTAPLAFRAETGPTITTIHDLIPLKLPNVTTDNKEEFLARVRGCVARSSLILTVSETSRGDIIDMLGVPEDKVVATPLYSDMTPLAKEERPELERVLRKYGLAPDGYLLFVGALEPKKNIRRLMEAFLETDVDTPLVVVGPKAWSFEREMGELFAAISDASRSRIVFTGYLSREDLRLFYGGARAFAFPSLYEGFGIPVLDAMQAGTPVLTSSGGSLPEVCGDAALIASPYDKRDIREKLERLLSDAGLREDLSARGLERARHFSRDRFVADMRQVYERLS